MVAKSCYNANGGTLWIRSQSGPHAIAAADNYNFFKASEDHITVCPRLRFGLVWGRAQSGVGQ